MTDILKEHPDMRVSIEGHVNFGQTPAQAQTLSMGRARQIRIRLASLGIDRARQECVVELLQCCGVVVTCLTRVLLSCSCVGHGYSKPRFQAKTAGANKNRRVEFVILGDLSQIKFDEDGEVMLSSRSPRGSRRSVRRGSNASSVSESKRSPRQPRRSIGAGSTERSPVVRRRSLGRGGIAMETASTTTTTTSSATDAAAGAVTTTQRRRSLGRAAGAGAGAGSGSGASASSSTRARRGDAPPRSPRAARRGARK